GGTGMERVLECDRGPAAGRFFSRRVSGPGVWRQLGLGCGVGTVAERRHRQVHRQVRAPGEVKRVEQPERGGDLTAFAKRGDALVLPAHRAGTRPRRIRTNAAWQPPSIPGSSRTLSI